MNQEKEVSGRLRRDNNEEADQIRKYQTYTSLVYTELLEALNCSKVLKNL